MRINACPIQGIFADNFGRRAGIIASCVLFSVGVAVQTAASNITVFVGECSDDCELGCLLTDLYSWSDNHWLWPWCYDRLYSALPV